MRVAARKPETGDRESCVPGYGYKNSPLSFCSPPSVTVPHFSLAASLPAVVTPNAPMSSYGVAGSLSGGASRGGGGDVGAGIGTTLKPSHNT